MKIAVTGANGQLGSELVRQGCIPYLCRLGTEDLINEIDIYQPDTIINCAAMTDVDGCEDNVIEAIVTNTIGVDFLSRHFKGYLIQISTDYIFDGQKGPYTITDKPNPLSIYGWSKLGGELITRRHQGPWLIVRTTILFSDTANNFVSKIVKRLSQGEKVLLCQPDLSGTPTYVPALATEIIRMAQEQYTGVAHVVGNRLLTRLAFTQMIAEAFKFDTTQILTTDVDPGGTPRPKNAGMICGHTGGYEIYSHDPVEGLLELGRKFREI